MKRFVKSLFDALGLEVSRKNVVRSGIEYFKNEEMFEGLRRCHAVLPPPSTIIDVGAASGSWSLSAQNLWPHSNYVLFEPLLEREVQLSELAKIHKNFHYILAAAGKDKGVVSFYVADDLDGSGVAGSADTDEARGIREVPVVSIEQEIERLCFAGPYLVKLDTHGFELPIIEGCTKLLPNISTFIIECYGFQIAENSLLFWEMCRYMDQLGFRLFDIVDVMHRPKDGAFWQCDAVFLKKDNPIFNAPGYE